VNHRDTKQNAYTKELILRQNYFKLLLRWELLQRQMVQKANDRIFPLLPLQETLNKLCKNPMNDCGTTW